MREQVHKKEGIQSLTLAKDVAILFLSATEKEDCTCTYCNFVTYACFNLVKSH